MALQNFIKQAVGSVIGRNEWAGKMVPLCASGTPSHRGCSVAAEPCYKDFFDSFKPTRAANGAIEFFSEDDEDIVQRINHMKDFFSYFIPSDRVKSKGMGKVA
ncbi:unnamed protein product [Miscanthus lutarioriparius]|uniref:Uncharacterized protein n=1 Tax=Miscanthus lutarioriparius TaxID=422564 RepID=A0A811S2B6_9POAL|nr:unnamed protein product [Miscanthus lutarioriparius]